MILLIITPPMIGTAETLKPNLCRGRPERGPVNLPVAGMCLIDLQTNAFWVMFSRFGTHQKRLSVENGATLLGVAWI
jgi:hypothetical protein